MLMPLSTRSGRTPWLWIPIWEQSAGVPSTASMGNPARSTASTAMGSCRVIALPIQLR